MSPPPVAEAWPEPVERVSAALRAAGAEARIEEFAAGTPTAEDAAAAVGCELRRIVKSLLFDCDGSLGARARPGRPPRRRATRWRARPAPNRARVAGAAQVEAAPATTPGAVAPFALDARRARPDRPADLPVDGVALGGRGLVDGTWPGCRRPELVRVTRARAGRTSQTDT